MHHDQNIRINKKYKILIPILLIIIIITIFFIFQQDYSKTYNINDYEIIEKYNSKTKRYSFLIVKYNETYELNFTHDYLFTKNLITNIEEKTNDKEKCILPTLQKELSTTPLCKNDTENIDYTLTDIEYDNFPKTKEQQEKNIEDIKIYTNLNHNYLLWKYNNLLYIDQDKNETIKLFNNDYYNIDLATKINNYFFIPDYDSGYEFQTVYLINIQTLKPELWKLNYELSTNSTILGTYQNNIYILDKKDKIEYELDIQKRTMKIVGNENKDGIIYENDKIKKVSILKIINDDIKFTNHYDQNYILENNKIYLQTQNTKTLITNQYIDKIIAQNDTYIYYLVKDNLYYYDIFQKETKVLQYFEWNFNNNNNIFIY